MKTVRRSAVIMLALSILSSLFCTPASADENAKLIALTFDDGPGAYTEELLDGLKERGAHVSFFIVGQNAEWNADTVKRAWAEGHQICCHTYNHIQLTKHSKSEIKESLAKTNAILDKAVGFDLDYALRPPYGSYDDKVLSAAGTPCYYWSVDTRDWESKNEEASYAEFMKAARDGSIVLMHDVHKTTIPAALRAIDELKSQGFEFVTLNEMLVRRGITPSSGKIYFSAYPDEHGTGAPLSSPVIHCDALSGGRRVSIDGDPRAKIFYTTNGETPDPGNSTQYTGSFDAPADAVITAVCVYDWNGFVSKPASSVVAGTLIPTLTVSSKNGRMVISGLSAGGDITVPNHTRTVSALVLLTLAGLCAFALFRLLRPKAVASGRRSRRP